ncbi:MAG: hypothetical protein ACI9MC_001788 [Kiritimatiellia bacterium]|jgi:hypothetical protein
MVLALLTQLILAAPFVEAERWSPDSLGGLVSPWEVAVSPSEDLVAIVDGRGRVQLMEADSGEIRWMVPVVRSTGGAQGLASFGPRGLAVAVRADRQHEMRIVVLNTRDGTIEPLGSAPIDSRVVDIRWTDEGHVITRTRERPTERELGDQLVERTWGGGSTHRNLGAWTGYPKVKASAANRVLVDATRYGLEAARSRRSELQIKPRLEVWDDRWDKSTARKLRSCPEWSPIVRISADGHRAYSQGKVRCTWDLDSGELDAAWEVPEMPWWSALSPDGKRVVERHGKGSKRYGVVRDVITGSWSYQIPELQGAAFTNENSLLVWTDHRLELRNLADGEVRWSVPLDGEVSDVKMSKDARAILVVERMSETSGLRVRVLGPDGTPRAIVSDVEEIRSTSIGGRRLLLQVRQDHLQVVDLHAPVTPRQPAHLASVSVLRVDDRGRVLSGDAEGQVLVRSKGAEPRAWRRAGEVRDARFDGDEVVWLSSVGQYQATKWFVHHSGPASAGRRPPMIAMGADAVLLTADGRRVVALHDTGPTVGTAGKGRHKRLPVWADTDGGPGPDPELAVLLPGTELVLAPSYVKRPKAALVWAASKREPSARYPLAMGSVVDVAADGQRLVVAAADGGGRVFRLKGGTEPVDLAVVDAPGGTCCVGVGGETVVLAAAKGEVHVYSAISGDLEQTLVPSLGGVTTQVAVSSDGRWITVSSETGEIVLFQRE